MPELCDSQPRMRDSHSKSCSSTCSLGSEWSAVSDGPPIRRMHSSADTSVVDDMLEDHRTVVRDELDPIPEVTVEFMLQHILPDPKVDVNATMTKLQESGVWTEGIGWNVLKGQKAKGLASKRLDDEHIDNGDTSVTEIQYLSKIKDIYNSIISCSQFHNRSSQEPTLTFANSPKSASVSSTQPHCYGALNTKQEMHTMHLNISTKLDNTQTSLGSDSEQPTMRDHLNPNWFDIACVGGYKVDDRIQDLNENVLDMVWSLHHIMRVDYRRRFVFGITTENENARMWFACRQILFVTQPFNLNTNSSQLVQLIASLAYATPTQLGYDPTMKLRWRDEGFHYDIECTTKRPDGSERTVLYRTRKILSDTAFNLLGRATRVYLASAVDQGNPSSPDRLVVLKDVWLDASRPREGDTLSELLEGASEEEKKLFVTVHQHGVVQIDNQDDSTQGLILKGQKIELFSRRFSKIFLKSDPSVMQELGTTSSSSGSTDEEMDNSVHDVQTFHLHTPSDVLKMPKRDVLRHHEYRAIKPVIMCAPKVHYRIIFADVGESLMQIADSGKATIRILDQVMCDITNALKYMATKGYVHRDVSAGNILWFGDHAKLSDLEFAKEYGTGMPSDACVGTYKFMAGEVMAGQHSVKQLDTQRNKARFVYNPIHDLESLWWVGVWCTICHYPAPFDKITQLGSDRLIHDAFNPSSQAKYRYRDFNAAERKAIKRVQLDADKLFPGCYAWAADYRMEEIHDKVRYASRLSGGYPMFFHAFNFYLYNMKQCISLAYREIQSALPRTEASYFTDVLRIPDPSPPSKGKGVELLESAPMSVHDRILQMLAKSRGLTEVEDIILVPLRSLDRYSEYIATQQTRNQPSPNHQSN